MVCCSLADISHNDGNSWTVKTRAQPRSSESFELTPCLRFFTATSTCAPIAVGLDKASLASLGFDLCRIGREGSVHS